MSLSDTYIPSIPHSINLKTLALFRCEVGALDFFAAGMRQIRGVELHRVDGVAALRLGEFAGAIGCKLDIYRAGAGDIFTPPYLQGGVDAQRTGWLFSRSRIVNSNHPTPDGAPLLENKEGRAWSLDQSSR